LPGQGLLLFWSDADRGGWGAEVFLGLVFLSETGEKGVTVWVGSKILS
jgi:hypothetical protein